MTQVEVGELLDRLLSPEFDFPFLADDPVQIPHGYELKQDVEITAFWTAMLAWGQRKTIINKSRELFDLMGDSPYDFVLNLNVAGRRAVSDFKHRTFNGTDALYFLEFFHRYYQEQQSLEDAFLLEDGSFVAQSSLIQFHNRFFAHLFAPQRTRKHVATPARKSACKRICLFLKWMVRKDTRSGDMGIWHRIQKANLILPVDVHVMRSITELGITRQKQVNWKLAEDVTEYLRTIDPDDPVKYDYALFVLSRYPDYI